MKMENILNVQMLVKHIANGTFSQKFCRLCLLPLDDLYEDVFTIICKQNKEYSVADALDKICHVTLDEREDYKICPTCFAAAINVYKFYLQTLRSEEVLNYYIDELHNQINLNVPEHVNEENQCLILPIVSPEVELFDYDILNHPYKRLSGNLSKYEENTEIFPESQEVKKTYDDLNELDDNLVIIMKDNNEGVYYQTEKNVDTKMSKSKKKTTRKRNPMAYKMCSRCPIQYRFLAKLKEHMKTEHGIDLFECQVCKVLKEGEIEFNTHLQSHTGIHTCEICKMVFKKRKTIIRHLKSHERAKCASVEGSYVCEVCGVMLCSRERLQQHVDEKHVSKYTCYYCGRMYKMQRSFEMHINKHEIHLNGEANKKIKVEKKCKQYTCSKCGREFVDERSLMWHERLHAGERPYACDVCGRRFVSLNRRNQHQLCSHTAPTRQCPLCPALFHLRSMVNTHIKKVHLRAHKRRSHCKRRNVFWRTETVPLQELSVSVQSEVLKMRAGEALVAAREFEANNV